MIESASAALGRRARGIRWSARSRLAVHPALFLPLARRRYPDAVVGPESQLLIDGFTRSAVTFAVIAFQAAQRSPVRVAHTLHAAGHVVEAVKRGVPSLVTIREPEAAVLSAVIREPFVEVRQALGAYVRFYERIRPYRSGFVVGRFDDITRDYGSVIRQLNGRFATRFDEFNHTADNVDECFAIIEDRARWPPWSEALGRLECGIIGIDEYRRIVASAGSEESKEVPEMRVPRPSPQREDAKRALRVRLEHPGLSTLRTRARRAYEATIST
jgi:hypothetical protein